ncbi:MULTISPECIES: SDR family NAD(P)-dependent oxidoreductase [unclassified Pseudoalteromonas]|uniref:SDR family NAD(P)-dependent oxidoreductase n=1 Tax=unclassified Pseudoalteromonas TaxID=194690 RepID=UPI000694FC50|nr:MULTISPECIES: SDR family NAD(P)-dependent oxidoreductase [unclassified Pseudoalteromonas]
MKAVKTVVITGANRGIGLAMVSIYANQGSKVIALCRQSSAKLNALANENVEIVENVDVATESGIQSMCDAIGAQMIDVLINNAGILRDESLDNLNLDTIYEQFQVNAVAPLKVCQSLLNNLTSGSKIALITSRMGSIADNGSGGRYGYFPLPTLTNKTCRCFFMRYIIYKASLEKSWFEFKKRVPDYKKWHPILLLGFFPKQWGNRYNPNNFICPSM